MQTLQQPSIKWEFFLMIRDIFTEADFLNSFFTDKPSEMLQEQEPLTTNEASQEQEPLTTDETGPSNLNLKQNVFYLSPEDICGYPNADKRKNKRKGCTKGKKCSGHQHT
jgi:hypothetical protein